MITCDAGCCRISGPVTVDSVGSLLRLLQPQIAGGATCLDLSAVDAADSAALALVFSAMREAWQAGNTLRCTGLPASFGVLAELYGVASLLPT